MSSSCGFRDTRWLQAVAMVHSKHQCRKVMSLRCGSRETRWLQGVVVFSLKPRQSESDEFKLWVFEIPDGCRRRFSDF